MAQIRHLAHAPIAEAVIDFRVRVPTEFELLPLKSLAPVLGNVYGMPKEIRLFEVGWMQPAGGEPASKQIDHGIVGFRYDSEDGRQIVQFRKDGLTFSRLAPYLDWETTFAEASRLYRLFVETAHPEEVTRIAVRYINRLLLPEAQVGDFSAFLTAPPPVPKEVSPVLTGFLTRVQVQDPVTGISGAITQTVQPGAMEPNMVPVILDLDFFEQGSRAPTPDSILPRFAALRDLKNRYFFASITEATATLCK